MDQIDEMIRIATNEYEKSKEYIETSYEKQILQVKTIYETSKFDLVSTYFNVLFNEKTLDTTEAKQKLDRFPIFPEGFINSFKIESERHIQLTDSLETKFLEELDQLKLKYTNVIQQLNEYKKNIPLTSTTWFSMFENDSDFDSSETDE